MSNSNGDDPETSMVSQIRKSISALPHDEQIHIRAIAQALRSIVVTDPLAAMAYALVGAEMQNEQ